MSANVKMPFYAEGLMELRKNLTAALPKDALAVFDKDAETLEKTHQSIIKLKAGEKAPDFFQKTIYNH